jgi:ribulose-5-phosphate 4-epimerase/fuculose-1-phosphate aldolase
MEQIFKTYLKKMISNRLIDDGNALLGLSDAALEWSQPEDPASKMLAPLFDHLNINALIFARPVEPYWTIIDYLAQNSLGPITPNDCETRTFLHDLPVAENLSADALIPLLQHRKSVIVKNHGIVTYGTVSLEQPFVTFSSVCFACFVKFFSDVLAESRAGTSNLNKHKKFEAIADMLPDIPDISRSQSPRLAQGPFTNKNNIFHAISMAGKQVVDLGLVDSSFGNISYCANDILYISQTGSFLDDLTGTIDPVPLDGSSCAGITASSELSAHMAIIEQTGCRAILHGHPKFSVILSMDCDVACCEHRGNCHKSCPHKRNVCGIPVVSGEVGTGPYGLCRTVPNALDKRPGVIVYGHGVFTVDNTDFNHALHKLIDIEHRCRIEYFKKTLKG